MDLFGEGGRFYVGNPALMRMGWMGLWSEWGFWGGWIRSEADGEHEEGEG